MATRQQLFEYIQRELNEHTQQLYTTPNKNLAFIYQSGFLQSVLADLCYNDTVNFNHFQQVIKRAKARARNNKPK